MALRKKKPTTSVATAVLSPVQTFCMRFELRDRLARACEVTAARPAGGVPRPLLDMCRTWGLTAAA